MAREQVKVSVATRGSILTKSLFNNYDACINPYVGCEFGCSYCYVRWLVKDDEKPWGDFVRLRMHLEEKLPKELDKGYIRLADGSIKVLKPDGTTSKRSLHRNLPIADARVVFGTMTDPYQPQERKHRLTRTALTILRDHPRQFRKVGIFTRSPIVVDDLELIRSLPEARIHFTVTPFPPAIMRVIEPISPKTERRWEVLRAIKAAGIRLHVNVSPVIPVISDGFVDEWARELAAIGPAEFFIDPMQAYKESFQAFEKAMAGSGDWPAIRDTMTDRVAYDRWKRGYETAWREAWARHGLDRNPDTLPIWCDHSQRVWRDMRTGEQMSHRNYGDDTQEQDVGHTVD